VCALLASAGPWHLCGSSSLAFIAGGAPHRHVWHVAHGGAALSPLLPFLQLSLLTTRILAHLP
jgi:hypothetical protein